MSIIIPSPKKLGLPKKFSQWRPGQEKAIEAFLSKKALVTGVQQPTGSGKSVSYISAALISKRVTVILTATKALQDQMMGDFATLGVVDIRGQNAFKCDLDKRYSVEYGPCKTASFDCDLKKPVDGNPPLCEYYGNLYRAKSSRIILTNYFWWFTHNNHLQDSFWNLGEIDCLVMDEADTAISCLYSYLQINVDTKGLQKTLDMECPGDKAGTEKWRLWATNALAYVTSKLKVLAEEVGGMTHASFNPHKMDRIKELYSAQQALSQLSTMSGTWHVGRDKDKLTFDPVTPDKDQIHALMFGNAKRIYATSATICPTTLDLLKVDKFDFIEGGLGCSPERRPVIHVRTLKVDYKTPATDMKGLWTRRIDDIIKHRLDRKGIIHTVSYDRAEILRENSSHRGLMYFHKPWNLQEVVAEFKATHAPAILVSPSLTHGYDFPYDECRYQIIGKLPFPNTSIPTMKERVKAMPELVDYLTMQSIEQMVGRGNRAPDDFCETFIVDDHILWWYPKNKKLATSGFRDSVKLGVIVVPKPKYRLEGECSLD